MALDDDCYNYISKLDLGHIVVYKFSEFETEELKAVKVGRTRAEYCWTCGPSIIEFFMNEYQLESCTYIDSDMIFYSDPKSLYDEIGDASIAITEHASPTPPKQGRYCVQFMYFKNDKDGMKCLSWWKDSCINWCYARFEGDKYGDQKYLEKFPVMFMNVCVLENRGAGVATWNMNQYKFNDRQLRFDGKTYQIVFFHFHGTGFEIKDDTLYLNETGGYVSNETMSYFEDYSKRIMYAYEKYLNKKLTAFEVKNWSIFRSFYQSLKAFLRESRIAQYCYYNILSAKYEGMEGKKL